MMRLGNWIMKSNPTVDPKPGLEVPTPDGVCTLLYPERAGHPEGNWIGVLLDGRALILTQEEVSEQQINAG